MYQLPYSCRSLVFALYGVYKNQYLVTKKAQKQEEVLKKQGLK
ncbi:phage holin [Peribacillus sp. NPDC006672]